MGNSPATFPEAQGIPRQHKTTLVVLCLAKLQQKTLLLAKGAPSAEML